MRKHPVSLLALAALLPFAATLRAEINPANFDTSVKPSEDFYRYANGGWLKTAVIPPDKAGWGTFEELDERSKASLHTILDRASTAKDATGITKLVGDFFASGMDEAGIKAAGTKPLQGALDSIAALDKPEGLPALIAALHRSGTGVGFSFSPEPDPKNSSMVIAGLGQGGLGLPDRDYYLNDDDASKKLRDEYVAHIGRMLALAGDKPEAASASAKAVMALETALAKGSKIRTELRDPVANYHRMSVDDLQKTTPHFSWASYFKAVGLEKPGDLDLGQPDFFTKLDEQISATPLPAWRDYLRWQLLSDASPFLGTEFDEEHFGFYGKTLTGQPKQSDRWKRVLKVIDGSIGQAMGQLYVAENFPPESKEAMLKLVSHLLTSMKQRLEKLEWMDEPTRARALEKLAAFTVKIGYPDKWRDYTGLVITRDAYVLNVRRSAEFDFAHEVGKIGKPVDKTEWHMSPSTVNAYYNPTRNEIVFPAGILQPPFFDAKADLAVNYGAIGGVIGHEISHGFDDSGRQFDGAGNLTDWWTPECAARFKERTGGIVSQFNDYVAIEDLKVNGSLTQGENIADLAGLKIAFAALKSALRESTPVDKIGGFTQEQRFFLSWATGWRKSQRPEKSRLLARTDSHSPAHHRVNGPFSNLDEFFAAFGIPEGSPMRRPVEKRVSIW